MTQKELKRVTVISQCVQGNLACARAAELLDLSPRQVKRLKACYRQGSAAALAHASRGRPSPRRLPERTRTRILQLARTRYAGFNDHHLHEKLIEQEEFSLSRETLRRLLRSNGIPSPRKRRPPAHRQRRLRSAREGELVQLDGSPHDWLEGRGPHLSALGMQDDASGKILAAQFFPSETAEGYFLLLKTLLRRFGIPVAFYGDRSGIFVRNDDHWTREEELAGKRQPPQFGRALDQLGITFIAAQSPQAKGVSNACGASCRIASAANSAWPLPAISTRPITCCAVSFPTTTAALLAPRGRPSKPGAQLRKISNVSAALYRNASSATTTWCNGTASGCRSRPKRAASASLARKFRSAKPSMAVSRSTTAIHA